MSDTPGTHFQMLEVLYDLPLTAADDKAHFHSHEFAILSFISHFPNLPFSYLYRNLNTFLMTGKSILTDWNFLNILVHTNIFMIMVLVANIISVQLFSGVLDLHRIPRPSRSPDSHNRFDQSANPGIVELGISGARGDREGLQYRLGTVPSYIE